MRLFKYIPSRHVEAFRDGTVRFQPLSFYQRHENQIAIGDPHEAMRLFRPPQGLEINNLTTGRKFRMPAAFVSQARADAIFVFCVSQALSRDLAQEFGADACVELTDGEAFLSQLEAAVHSQVGSSVSLHRAVSYFQDADPPGVNWALPEAIVMSKRAFYSGQSEYRFAFGKRGVFDLGQTVQQLALGDVRPSQSTIPGPRLISIGNIRQISLMHSWPAA